jgi:parvulin-like peptidyl-prolyl isomerase
MKKLTLIIIALLISSLSTVGAVKAPPAKPVSKPKAPVAKPAAKKPPEWAAKVNGDTISMALFNKRLDVALRQITRYTSIEAAEKTGLIKATKKSILEQMIEAVILMQWAEREGIEIKDKTIKARISQLKKSFPTAHEFHKSLAEQGLTPDDLVRDIKKQIIIDKLMKMRANALAVSDEEIKAYYDRSVALSAQKEKLHLLQITMKDEKDIRAEKLMIDAGAKFSGDDIGFVERGQLAVSDDSQVFTLKKGEISDVISGEAGYSLFKVVERLPEEKKFEDVRDDIRKYLLKEKSRTQYLKDLEEEKANAKITLNERLAGLFSPVTSQEAEPRP